MKFDVETLGDQVLLVLEGEITIQDIAALREAILTCMSDSRGVVVDLDGVTRADLTFLQLLCSAHRKALTEGTPMGLRGGRPERIQSLINESGYARMHGCSLDTSHTCLWATGGKT